MGFQTVNENKLIVTQANNLVYAAYEMTLIEKRLLYLLFSMVRQNDKSFHTYHIPVRQIADFLEIDKQSIYKVLDETCTKLMSRVLHVQKPDGDWDKFHWVSRASYKSKGKSKTGEAELELKIHDELHPMLLELKKQFASVPFHLIAHLPSYHAIRIFEILYHKSQSIKLPEITIELTDLKKYLGVENKYPNFGDFKRRVLDMAQKHIKKSTPLIFTYQTIKEGRKVVALKFLVEKNPNLANFQLEFQLETPLTLRYMQTESFQEEGEETFKSTLLERLVDDFGIKAKQAMQFLEKYDKEYIEGNLEVIEKQVKAGKVNNIAAYTSQALTNDYRKKKKKQKQGKEDASIKQLEIPPQHKSLIVELSQMGYLGNGLKLIQNIGEQEVQDVISLAKEQKEASKNTGQEIKNMGGLINWLVETEAWKAAAIQRRANEEKQQRIREAQRKADRSKKIAELLEDIKDKYGYAYRDYIDQYWQATLTNEDRELIKENIKLNANNFVIEQISSYEWKEDNVFFIVEREAALERLNLLPELPDYLESEKTYLHSMPEYQNIESEIIEGVIAALDN